MTRRSTGGSPSSTPRSTGGWSTRRKQTNAIHKQLGDVGQATAQLAEQAKDLGQLQQILRPPKARGGFGELLLGNLLADRLPADAYSLQYTFRAASASTP